MNGKGDTPRALQISQEEWEERWTSINWCKHGHAIGGDCEDCPNLKETVTVGGIIQEMDWNEEEV